MSDNPLSLRWLFTNFGKQRRLHYWFFFMTLIVASNEISCICLLSTQNQKFKKSFSQLKDHEYPL